MYGSGLANLFIANCTLLDIKLINISSVPYTEESCATPQQKFIISVRMHWVRNICEFIVGLILLVFSIGVCSLIYYTFSTTTKVLCILQLQCKAYQLQRCVSRYCLLHLSNLIPLKLFGVIFYCRTRTRTVGDKNPPKNTKKFPRIFPRMQKMFPESNPGHPGILTTRPIGTAANLSEPHTSESVKFYIWSYVHMYVHQYHRFSRTYLSVINY